MSRARLPALRSALVGLAFAALPIVAAQAGDGCRYPFVWREAFRGDHVCVTPGTRSQAADDNAHAAERVNLENHDYGPDTCLYGFVWREARPSDHVCVTPGTRTQAAQDNAQAYERYATGHREERSTGTDCCPRSNLVCPLGRHWCG